MQFGAVLAPIAAVTIVNTILAGFAWRGTVVARRTGRLPKRVEVGLEHFRFNLVRTLQRRRSWRTRRAWSDQGISATPLREPQSVDSAQTENALASYIAVMAATFYLLKDARIGTPLSLFGAVLVGEGMGIMIAQTAAQAFLGMQGQPWRRRAFPALAAVAFTIAVFAGVFAT